MQNITQIHTHRLTRTQWTVIWAALILFYLFHFCSLTIPRRQNQIAQAFKNFSRPIANWAECHLARRVATLPHRHQAPSTSECTQLRKQAFCNLFATLIFTFLLTLLLIFLFASSCCYCGSCSCCFWLFTATQMQLRVSATLCSSSAGGSNILCTCQLRQLPVHGNARQLSVCHTGTGLPLTNTHYSMWER